MISTKQQDGVINIKRHGITGIIEKIENGKIKGVIFDLDGTLVDSMGVWDKVDEEFLGMKGIEVPCGLGDEIKNMTFREAAIYFKERFGIKDDVEDIMQEWNDMGYYEYAHNVQLKPGVREFLHFLKGKGIKIGIATTNYIKLVEAVLKNNGVLEFFNAISTANEVEKGKEHPDIYLLTARKLGLEPEECVVFEDILPAVRGAKAAGMKVIGVYDKYSRHEAEEIKKMADGYISGFETILP
ncbi:MAG: HAD family phosphatase [Clostridiaceae bacterium]|nr:HAD family phosphatase [Clostridiaceae bacterium]